MNNGIVIRTLICILAFGFSLYSFIDAQNEVTQARMAIPDLNKELKTIREDNMRLQYKIDQFENPQHLMELARNSEFSHLKHPLLKEIITVKEGLAVQHPQTAKDNVVEIKPVVTLASTNH